MPEAELLLGRLRALGLRHVEGLAVTDNRSVMVSLTPRRVVRIHRGFVMAPDRVLKAVVRFLTPGLPRALRRAAEHEILGFAAEAHAAAPPARPRAAERAAPGDAAKLERLLALFREYNVRHFAGALPALPIRLSGRMRSRLGHLTLAHVTGEPLEIALSRRHVDAHGWDEAGHTLLHEMVHLWQHANGHQVDHGPAFRAKAREVGVAPGARRWVRRRRARTD
jgi:hypothetical protein